jgi:hypothetical protein
MRRSVLLAFFWIVLGGVVPCVNADSITMPSVPADSVYFFNSAGKTVFINISIDNRNWTEVQVESQKGATVALVGTPPSVFVAIQTGNNVFRGDVKLKSRYEIYWDNASQVFSVRPLVPR